MSAIEGTRQIKTLTGTRVELFDWLLQHEHKTGSENQFDGARQLSELTPIHNNDRIKQYGTMFILQKVQLKPLEVRVTEVIDFTSVGEPTFQIEVVQYQVTVLHDKA